MKECAKADAILKGQGAVKGHEVMNTLAFLQL